ncbi:MAG: glycosyltransferase [Chloroflexi bacterium]|nr:glycosyltransferase [Chloroflexota bacterium]
MHILYVYNRPNWAIHNVGKYWARLLGEGYSFTYCSSHEVFAHDLAQYDIVWWGYSQLAPSILAQIYRVGTALFGKHHGKLPPAVTVIHDPCEIFPIHANWKGARPNYRNLSHFVRMAVTSHEMQSLLGRDGFQCVLINSNSHLPLREERELAPERLRLFSRGWRGTTRKNVPLARAVRRITSGLWEACDLCFDWRVRPLSSYIALIDSHNCYLCTSWQEGGPLPLMDAMRRGCAVLTTPVGQTDEWVIDGVNGFFCRNRSEFIDRIRYLAAHPDALYTMRVAALRMAAARDDALIRAQLLDFLQPFAG